MTPPPWPLRQQYLRALMNAREVLSQECDRVQRGDPVAGLVTDALLAVVIARLHYIDPEGDA